MRPAALPCTPLSSWAAPVLTVFLATATPFSWSGLCQTATPLDPQPRWIWHNPDHPVAEATFTRVFTLPPGSKVTTALFAVTADAAVCRVSINDEPMGEKPTDWRGIWGVRLARHLRPGRNVLTVVAGKPGKPAAAGLVGRLAIHFESGPPMTLVTDGAWQVATRFKVMDILGDEEEVPPAAARELGPLSMQPWNLQNLTPTPPPVVWPAAPATRPLTPDQGRALLEADWLMQANNDPSLALVREEIEIARGIARRFASHPARPTFTAELAELDRLATRNPTATREGEADEALRELYVAVRRVKREIVLRNPAIDFRRLLLIDGSPPAGHESGHRNTYGGDLRRTGENRLLVLDGLRPDAGVREVVPGQAGGLMRMDLHFGARRLVYSLVPSGENAFHLYEVTLTEDGVAAAPPRQLTGSAYHDLDPIYLPDGGILFATTRGNTYVRCLPNSPCSVLARCDADGRNIRIISINNEPEYTPCILPDGRVLYTRWEYTERPLWRLQALWAFNPDGTAVTHFWGNRSNWPDMLWEARPIPGTDKVMFTGVGHHDVGGGPIGIVDTAEGRDYPDGLYKVTTESSWTEVGDPPVNRTYSSRYRKCPPFARFASPYPFSTHDFLVSARGGRGSEGFRLYLMDVEGNRELIYAGTWPGGVWCAMPLRPRATPPVIPERSQWAPPGQPSAPGVFFSANVLEGVEGLQPGQVKYLRVLQQDHKTYSMGFKSFRHSGPVISALQEDAVKRILGTVPVAADGSVCFRVPPGRAVYFQLLDEHHRCLQIMRSFTGTMPGERRGCLGCHESHGKAMPPAAGALSREPLDIQPPPWGADTSISYERFAQPVLDKHCGKCHQGEGKGRAALDLTLRGGEPEGGITDPKLLPFKEPYMTLIGNTAWTRSPADPKGRGYGLAGALPVEAGGYRADPYGPIKPLSCLSYASRLIALASGGKHHEVKVSGEDLLRLIAWVDANCVYRGEEEVRQIPDPDEDRFRKAGWLVPPKTCTAPVIDRLAAQTDPLLARAAPAAEGGAR